MILKKLTVGGVIFLLWVYTSLEESEKKHLKNHDCVFNY